MRKSAFAVLSLYGLPVVAILCLCILPIGCDKTAVPAVYVDGSSTVFPITEAMAEKASNKYEFDRGR